MIELDSTKKEQQVEERNKLKPQENDVHYGLSDSKMNKEHRFVMVKQP